MLVIGDIHLQAKFSEAIITSIRDFIDQNPEDDSIVFVGDYVYHFSYHRKSLLALFAFFLELWQKGKNVYVLAGNHDWLGQHFVFAEGHYALDILYANNDSPTSGHIEFIVEPGFRTIQGKTIYFLPYTLQTSGKIDRENIQSQEHIYENPVLHTIAQTSLQLCKSQDTHEQFSGQLNLETLQNIHQWQTKNPTETITIVHHYYIAQTVFPGQKTQFHYRDKALCPAWLQANNVQLLSGHIHQPFALDNYLCVGSVWSTSPLEYNQYKYLWKRDTKQDTITAIPLHLNPYLRLALEKEEILQEDAIHQQWSSSKQESEKALTSSQRTIIFGQDVPLPLASTTIHVQAENLNYDSLASRIEPTLQTRIKKAQISKTSNKVGSLLAQLQTETKDFSGGWHDWKQILHEYISKKYPDETDLYMKELQDLGLA